VKQFGAEFLVIILGAFAYRFIGGEADDR